MDIPPATGVTRFVQVVGDAISPHDDSLRGGHTEPNNTKDIGVVYLIT